MKKAALWILLVLLAAVLVLPVSAATEEHPHAGSHCVCGGSAEGVHDHECQDITWEAMPADAKDFGKLDDGSYYLTEDLTITGVTTLLNKKLTICLNGYDINTATTAVFGYAKAGCQIKICDCSGTQNADGNWTWGGTITANQTGKARPYGGVINLNANAHMSVYGGNFVGATGGSAKSGGIFTVCNDGFADAGVESNTDPSLDTRLTIYNGHFTGGEVSEKGGIINTWHTVYVDIYGGTFVGGTATTNGNFSISNLTVENCIITGGNPGVVLVMDNAGNEKTYTTLASALKAVTDTKYIRLTGDIHEEVTIPDGVLIDLAGNNLSGVTISDGVCFMDSTTDGYYGGIAGSVTPVSGTVQKTYKTTAAQAGAVKRYLAIEENGSYAFHRYYMGLTKVTLKPGTVGIGYKATFAGSEELRQQLSTSTAYGYKMWLTEESKLTRGYSADRFGGIQELTLRIDNFLNSSLTEAENDQRANMPVYACAYIRLADGTVLETAPVSYSFRDIMEMVAENYTGFNTTQKNAVSSLHTTYRNLMNSWDIYPDLHHKTVTGWKAKNESGFKSLLSNNKLSGTMKIYLTQDVNLTSTITVASGANISICLNGHTIKSTTRAFNIQGTLNLYDCHNCDSEGCVAVDLAAALQSNGGNTTVSSTGTLNLYGGIITGGMVTHSSDGKTYYNGGNLYTDGTFNMYGGTITGGQTDRYGGNVRVNKGTFKMYGGTINSGNANEGGNISAGSSAQVEMLGGTITGGVASQHGGNIMAYGSLNISGGRIENGQAAARGGNIGSHGNKTNIHISGGVIADGSAKQGGNIAMYTPSETVPVYLTISGGRIDRGTSTTTGGSIYISPGSTTTISGGTIEGGTATTYGGNIYNSGTLNMSGGTVTGGKASGSGGGIYAYNSDTNITGNAVIDGNIGSNLYTGLVTVNINALGEKAKVGISGGAHGFISNDPTVVSRLSIDQEGYRFHVVNGKVLLLRDTYTPGSIQDLSQFSVGYDTTNINPTETGLAMSSWGNPNGRKTDGTVGFDLHATTVAITDAQNNTVLMVTLDLQGHLDHHELYRNKIAAATGVPADNIYLSATHTHNCPDLTSTNEKNVRYVYMLVDLLIESALDALADRAPATMKTGSFETNKMNFVRHYYYYKNNNKTTNPIYFGDNFGTPPQNNETIYYTHDGDHTMHMLAFERTGKQPVLITNWRAHPHRSGGKYSYSVDADVIGATREYMHANTNYLFAYFEGAAGNMNTTSQKGETYKSGKIKEFGNELGRQIINGLSKLKTAETGLIQTQKIIYAAPVDHSEDAKAAVVDEFVELYNKAMLAENEAEMQRLLDSYGFSSKFHAQRVKTKSTMGETKELELNVFSIGKSVGFYTAPAELWDTFSAEIEGISQFGTTFCLGYCNGFVAYIPYKVTYNSYEGDFCLFNEDVAAPTMMTYYLEELQKQFENAK